MNDQQIFISEVPETVFKTIKTSLGHFPSFEMEASPFAFSSEHFWHSLLDFFFFLPFTWIHLGMEMNVELVSLFQLNRV